MTNQNERKLRDEMKKKKTVLLLAIELINRTILSKAIHCIRIVDGIDRIIPM